MMAVQPVVGVGHVGQHDVVYHVVNQGTELPDVVGRGDAGHPDVTGEDAGLSLCLDLLHLLRPPAGLRDHLDAGLVLEDLEPRREVPAGGAAHPYHNLALSLGIF